MAIVKANAYGHGAVEIAQALARQGIERFAVASLDEGIALRQAGLSASIVVLGALFEEQVSDLIAHRLTPVVSDGRILPALAKAAPSHPVPYPIHLKVETGMGRLGFSPEELLTVLDNPLLHSPLQVEGMMTHLADADGEDSAFTERQLALSCHASNRSDNVGSPSHWCIRRTVPPSSGFPTHTFHSCAPASCSTGTTPCRP